MSQWNPIAEELETFYNIEIKCRIPSCVGPTFVSPAVHSLQKNEMQDKLAMHYCKQLEPIAKLESYNTKINIYYMLTFPRHCSLSLFWLNFDYHPFFAAIATFVVGFGIFFHSFILSWYCLDSLIFFKNSTKNLVPH